mgnify:CR=1 FL=1
MSSTEDIARSKKRLMLISRVNAFSVIVLALLFGALSLLGRSAPGCLVGLGLVGAGVVEVIGHRRLDAGQSGARHRMVLGQLIMISVVLIYCSWRLFSFDAADPLAGMPDLAQILQGIADMGIVNLEMLKAQVGWAYVLTYRLVAVVVTLSQGLLALYYWRAVGGLVAASTSVDSV